MRRLGRRQFTAGIGATLLASPLVRLLNGEAQAAAPIAAKRLIVFFTPNGTVHKYWRPTGTETSFTFAAGSMLEPLNRLRSKLLVCDGLDFVGADNHDPGMAHMLTGSGTASSPTAGMSIDQYVASKLGQGSRFKSLEFGVQTSLWGASRSTRMSYSAPGVFVSPEDVPLNAYQRLFGSAGGTSTEAERLLRRRKSMLDVARTDLTALSSQVGAEEKIKLEQHIQALRQTEQALAAASTTACSPGQSPAVIDAKANANFPQVGKMQMDLLVNALACGMTRVASLQWSHTIAPQVFTWAGASEAHHELSHKVDSNTAGVASFVKCERWFAEQFAYLLDALQARPDLSSTTGGTMLDSTLVLWAKELGDSRLHTCRSVPFILAGGSGTPFRFGRYLRYTSTPHQKLLTSVCQGMGLTLDTFGDASRSTGPLSGLV
ncbi:Tat (twin-arginine translocation) pathway signal sequence domain protein [Cystobacter fuscus]|uniref:Tat (Twin-arginine translocation) pathway signal sequence domain protein n=1 Tax=Cystobacter fuscus TaxID=43 RepID=A0A250J0S5_9BACT|nr:DUF1552 domain-containing protein [Cystobacter fuscus]ATB37579.1 Tat (twin-arginine translocation) pathway signal sequence domain protein [Cystobacter fuscus]